ncbi:MAG: serine/threonine protein kinase [Gemmatimonadaceae bacterium]|nr:serine/threonine protein kinase [Gemmatimonadaceae bacterium]
MYSTPTPRTDPAFLALQSALAGRFSLESELGRGGMGIVFLARDVILERPVAIKLLAPAFGAREDMRRRFLREARVAAQCFHPHIVPIHEVAESGELAWFVMGYVQGETLADRLQRIGPLPPDAVRRIGREIGWALSYAHERGVVHRDVKPENILLEQSTGRALIADFGIALPDRATHASGEVMGTARFMAPEQALGDAVDGRADLYALGVTLYLASTGHYPFEGASAMAVVARQTTARAPSVRQLAPGLPHALGNAIDQCLAPVPDDRYDNAAAFVAALERTPEGGELPAEARDIRQGMLSTVNLVDWGIAMALAGIFLVMGETPRSFGRSLMANIVQTVLSFTALVTALRGGETVWSVHRALRTGVDPDIVVDALAPGPSIPHRASGPLKAIAMLFAGFLLALGQAKADELGLPSALHLLANILTWIVPPVLIHRAITGLRSGSGVSAWLYSFIRKPLAQQFVRLLGGRKAGAAARPVPASAPTEVMLEHAADAIFARLAPATRAQLSAVPGAAAALAREAEALRAQAHIAQARGERPEIEARLGTTIAALESIRVDLLRVEAEAAVPGNLTEQLEVVQELHRRIDAMQEVERTLSRQFREPTPA